MCVEGELGSQKMPQLRIQTKLEKALKKAKC
jgi:hypothetical protein